jgi:hypothetical protein
VSEIGVHPHKKINFNEKETDETGTFSENGLQLGVTLTLW